MAMFSDLEQIHEGIAATPESCIAELGKILENIPTDPNLSQPTSFPAHLFDAILKDGVTVSSHDIKRLITALGKMRKLHKSLNGDSIYLLAYLLLTSDDKAEQEIGLHLLLENFRNHTETHAKPSTEEMLPSSGQPLPIRYELIPILYTIFLGQDRNVKCRRMAGKLLVESMIECRDNGIPIFQLQDLSSYCPRTVFDAHHEADIVLRFFAGLIIRTLHLSGTNEDLLWSNCDQNYRDTLVDSFQRFPDDWIRSFQLLVSDVEHHDARNTRASSRKSGRFGSTTSRFLAQSITIGAQAFARYSILASTTPNGLIFILPSTEADREHFQYIEIPDKCISQCTTKDMGEQKYALRLILDTTGSLMMNGEERPLNGSTVYITSDNDLGELYNALKESEKKPQKGGVIRRISSTVVALDNGEEVARKSIQHSENSSEQKGCLLVKSDDAMNDDRWSGISRQPANEENTQSELAQVTPAINENQPRASQEMYTSGAASGETFLAVSTGKKATPGPRDGDVQPPGKVHPIGGDTSLAEACLEKIDSPVLRDLASNAESEANADNRTRSQASNAVPFTLQPRRSSRSSTCEHQTQNKSPVSRKEERRASSNRKGRSKLPDTQESLIFPLRRSNRKVYTSNSKAAVDWEEDLRPTEEDETEREVQKDLDVTSISSPSPGGKSIFDRKPNTAQKKKKARATPSSIKDKKPTKRNRTSANKCNKKTTKLPLQPKESNRSNDKVEKINSPRTNNAAKDINGGMKLDNCVNSRPDISSEKKSWPGLAHNSTRTNSTFPVRDQDLLSEKENRDPSVKSPREQGESGNIVISGIGPDMKTASDLQEQSLGEREQVSPDREGVTFRDRYSLSQDHGIPLSGGDDEQTSLTRCISTQGALIPDEGPNHEATLDQLEDSLNPKAVSKTDEGLELLPASAEKYQTLNTLTQAATNEENIDDSRQSISEQHHPAPDKKRSASRDRTCESQSKKLRMSVSPAPYQQTMPQTGDTAAKDSGNDGVSAENPQEEKRSTRTSTGEECFTTPSPTSWDLRVGRIVSPVNVSSQTKLSPLPTSSPKKSIVDENGSPRLVSRHYDNLDLTRREFQFPRLDYSDEDASSHSEYYGDHDDADFTDYSVSDKSNISTPRPHAIASTTNEPKTHPVSVLPGDTNKVEEVDHFNMGSRIPVTERLRRCAKEPNQLVKTMITPYSILGSPRRGASPGEQDPVLQGSPSNDFAQTQPEVTEPSKPVGRGHSQPDWQRSFEAMQKATQDMLLSTNQRLTDQLEGEKDTISQVLDSYRQGCHRFLDQLFHAHEQRIELYRQQMSSVRRQHEDICRDLIRRCEENDKRIQERLSIAL